MRTGWVPWAFSLCLLPGLQGLAQAQQTCQPDARPSSPTSRFTGADEGHITDGLTQLMWMRCPVGQAWVSGACQGSPARLDWSASAAEAKRINASGEHFYNDWRVPSLRELATVAERQCTHPRINLTVFPGTPAAPFWSGTPSLQTADHAYSLDFAAGGVVPLVQSTPLLVRLVRNAP